MHVSKPRDKTDIYKILRRVAESVSGRGMMVIISDLLVDREPLFKGLEMLWHRRHDVLVFHVLDDDEMNFPFAGTTRFEGMEDVPQLLCDPRALRDGYIEALEEYLVEGSPRLHPAGHRLLAGQDQRLPRRRPVQVPAPSHGPTSIRQGTNSCFSSSSRFQVQSSMLAVADAI